MQSLSLLPTLGQPMIAVEGRQIDVLLHGWALHITANTRLSVCSFVFWTVLSPIPPPLL